MRGVFAFEDCRPAAVAALADVWIEFNGSQEGNAELLRRPRYSTFRKDVDLMVAMRTDRVAHVFHQAENVYASRAEHLDGLAPVLKRNIRRSRDHYSSGERNGLEKRDDHVSGAGRQINYQVIQLSPLYLLQELANDRVQHGTAPHQRL